MNKTVNLVDIDAQLQQSTPQEVLEYALAQHDNLAISFSGAEDIVLIDMATRIKPNVEVFCLDTGRLHAETYQFMERVRKHYAIKMDILFPNADSVQKLVASKGLFSFYDDDHKECCGIRKVGPLRAKLLELDAWVTGQRKDQSPGTRASIPVIQNDKVFARPNEQLTKFNPLVNWTSQQVWDYIRANDVPYNALHDAGYVSIGCEPCTRPVGPGQHEREGRWWWEESTKKECGLHSTNSAKP
ncbi:phosphoadenylyl-sulfate reductase [Teredinibacter purpureus]|uniref:phosphoadenylyl-sulfate reductase n=1 Tax=Teredinibacter purpureus TaxID=2731756 RepID=UPI0005F89546|nr:phosphoadenylyl-sulfate reductase [Teredinibacter purpureus]